MKKARILSLRGKHVAESQTIQEISEDVPDQIITHEVKARHVAQGLRLFVMSEAIKKAHNTIYSVDRLRKRNEKLSDLEVYA